MNKVSSFFGTVLLSYVALILSCSTPASITPINMTPDGVAIKGYDPVAYFTMGRPVQGQEEFQYQWQGASWFFANQGHLEMFQENPERYAPQYGGY